jgi:cytochrome c-type biogenesis protein CcmH
MIIIASLFLIKKPVNKSLILSIIFITLSSLSLYQYTGNAEEYRSYLYITKINQLISEIQTHLKADPTSYEGWYLLGKLYLSQNRIQEANNAFAKAQALEKNKAE